MHIVIVIWEERSLPTKHSIYIYNNASLTIFFATTDVLSTKILSPSTESWITMIS